MSGLFFTTTLRPYRFGLAVSIAQDPKQLNKDLLKLDRRCGTKARPNIMQNYRRISPISTGFVLRVGVGDAFMWLKAMPTTTATCGVALHEMLHVTAMCLMDRGIKISRKASSHEPYCYLLEDLHVTLYDNVNNHLRGRTK